MCVLEEESLQLQRQLERDKEERWSEESQIFQQLITEKRRKIQKRRRLS